MLAVSILTAQGAKLRFEHSSSHTKCSLSFVTTQMFPQRWGGGPFRNSFVKESKRFGLAPILRACILPYVSGDDVST